MMIGDRLVVGRLALNQETEVRPLLPELATRRQCLDEQRDAGSSNGRMRRSERLHVGSIPASAASPAEVIRPDEEPVLKTGGGQQPLVGSSPTASALWGHGPTGRRWLRKPEIPVRVPVTPLESHSPVVQRQRRLVHIQETMVRLHPGLLDGPGTPIGRAAWLKPRRLRVRLRPWARPGRQTADHLGLEPGMLWVRVPPGPLEIRCPRGAAWSARLPVTQEIAGSNPVEGAGRTWRGTQIGKAAKLKPW